MSMKDTEHALQRTMEALVQVFPESAIVLVVAPFEGPPNQRANYISNAERDDIRVLLKEVLARWEGRHHEAPVTKQ